jgi:hypothetical protein
MGERPLLDIRTPIGLMFLVIGAVLAAFGALGDPSVNVRAGVNINLWWGLVLLVFGGVMFWLGRREPGP